VRLRTCLPYSRIDGAELPNKLRRYGLGYRGTPQQTAKQFFCASRTGSGWQSWPTELGESSRTKGRRLIARGPCCALACEISRAQQDAPTGEKRLADRLLGLLRAALRQIPVSGRPMDFATVPR
jgi:hypothetical protein